MKKITLLCLVIAAALAGCKKSSTEEPAPAAVTTNPTIGAVPATFTQKVMVEENTGAWCGWCVLGAEGIKTADEAYPNRVNAIALHGGSGEPMTVPEYSAMLTFCAAT